MSLQYRGVERSFRDKLSDIDEQERIIRASETPFFILRPGDIVQFGYSVNGRSKTYQGLIVSTKRSGAKGYRLTKEAYTILQVLTFEDLSDDILNFVINILYKNRILSRYLSIKNRSSTADKMIEYGYLTNLGREDTELEESLKESTLLRRGLGREGRRGLVRSLEEGQFKTFRTERLFDILSISLLNPELAQ